MEFLLMEKCNTDNKGFCSIHLRFHKKLNPRQFRVDKMSKPGPETNTWRGFTYIIGNKLFRYQSETFAKKVYELRNGDKVLCISNGRSFSKIIKGVKK